MPDSHLHRWQYSVWGNIGSEHKHIISLVDDDLGKRTNDVFSRTSVRYIGSPQRIYNAKKLKLKRVQYRFNLKQFHIGGILFYGIGDI